MQLHPMAYQRESERLQHMARLANAEMDERTARRWRLLARTMARKGVS